MSQVNFGFIIVPFMAIAWDIPIFLYITIFKHRINIMIRFKSKGHGYRNRYFIFNGRYLF